MTGVVGPLELHGPWADLLGLPRTDVADLAMHVVVPSLARNRVGDRLAQLVRTRGGQCIGDGETSRAAGASRIRHDRIEDLPGDVVVVTAERRAGRRTALYDTHTRRKVDEIQSVRSWVRKRVVCRYLVLLHMLDGGIRDRSIQRGCGDGDSTGMLAVPDRMAGNAVLVKLVDQRAGQDEIEEPVDLRRKLLLRRVPGRAPENGEHFDIAEQRTISIGEMRRRCGARRHCRLGRLVHRFWDMQWDDADRVAVGGINSAGTLWFGCHYHCSSRCDVPGIPGSLVGFA